MTDSVQTRPLICHIDDTSTARTIFASHLKTVLPDAELASFEGGRAFQEFLDGDSQSSPRMPWMVFTDWKMAGVSGIDLLNWLKRHHRLHHVPIVMVTAEADADDRELCRRAGAFTLLAKPIDVTEFANLLSARGKMKVSYEEWIRLDLEFVKQTLRQIEPLLSAQTPFERDGAQNVLHLLHTIKGESLSLSMPSLGTFVHDFESALLAAQSLSSLDLPITRAIFTDGLQHIKTQCSHLLNNRNLEVPPPPLLARITSLESALRSGLSIAGSLQQQKKAASQEPEPEPQNLSTTALELSIQRFEELQSCFKQVLMQTVQLNALTVQLMEHHPGDAIVRALEEKIRELSEQEHQLLDVMTTVFTVPSDRVRLFAESAIQTTGRQLGKSAQLTVEIDSGLEVDQAVFETLKFVLTHLIRNALDHGVEPLETRLTSGKPSDGQLRVKLQAKRKYQVVLTLEDDGSGVDVEQIRKTAVLKGLATPAQVAQAKPEELLDYLFLDGFTTRAAPGEVSGRGIGLGAVKKLLLAKGGYIHVRSEIGHGTTFEVMVPRVLQLIG